MADFEAVDLALDALGLVERAFVEVDLRAVDDDFEENFDADDFFVVLWWTTLAFRTGLFQSTALSARKVAGMSIGPSA